MARPEILGGLNHSRFAGGLSGAIRGGCRPGRGPWRSDEALEHATLEWGDWFNTHRLLEPVGNVPPAEAEAAYHAAFAPSAMAALPKPSGLRQTRGGSGSPLRRRRKGPHVNVDGMSKRGALQRPPGHAEAKRNHIAPGRKTAAARSSRVYGCWGEPKTSPVGPISTIRPCRITAM